VWVVFNELVKFEVQQSIGIKIKFLNTSCSAGKKIQNLCYIRCNNHRYRLCWWARITVRVLTSYLAWPRGSLGGQLNVRIWNKIWVREKNAKVREEGGEESTKRCYGVRSERSRTCSTKLINFNCYLRLWNSPKRLYWLLQFKQLQNWGQRSAICFILEQLWALAASQKERYTYLKG